MKPCTRCAGTGVDPECLADFPGDTTRAITLHVCMRCFGTKWEPEEEKPMTMTREEAACRITAVWTDAVLSVAHETDRHVAVYVGHSMCARPWHVRVWDKDRDTALRMAVAAVEASKREPPGLREEPGD